MMFKRMNKRGLGPLEYAIILVIVILALIATHLYMRRGVQGRLKQSADTIGNQFDTANGYITAWQEEGEGETVTEEVSERGEKRIDIARAEKIIRREYESWGDIASKIGGTSDTGAGPGESGTGTGGIGGAGGERGGETGGIEDTGNGIGETGGGTAGGTGGGTAGGTGGGTGGGTAGGGGETDDKTGGIGYYSSLEVSVALLENSPTGGYYYDLIIDKNINVVYEYGMAQDILAYWKHYAYNNNIVDNTIYVNVLLQTQMPEPGIAAVIAHEATHADYQYNPDRWINYTLAQHPELTINDLHIDTHPYNSIDQEYNGFKNSALVWKELKGSYANFIMDDIESMYYQGESYLKEQIIANYGDQLPAY